MSEKSSNTKKVICLVCGCLIAAILGWFTGYKLGDYEDEILNTDSKDEDTTGKVANDETLPEWMLYLLSSEISEIELRNFTSCSVDATSGEENGSSVILSVSDLKDILTKATNNKITKSYLAGLGGSCGKYLTISYNNYKLDILDGNYILSSDDEKLLSLLENEEYTSDDECSSNTISCYFNLNLAEYLEDYAK